MHIKIIFIGSGNVATHMAQALRRAGHEIVQVYSPTFGNAALLANKVGAQPINQITDINRDADLYLFSVKDDALSEVVSQMPLTDGIWAHTAGSVPLSTLSPHQKRGVLYPLQTFSRARAIHFRNIPLFIEGDSDETISFLKNIAEMISSSVHLLSSDKRRFLHLAAVFACNFTNHMYNLASDIAEEQDIPFHLMVPLITETAAKIVEMRPSEAQTGPAVRFDEKVIEKHLELLNSHVKKEIYSLLSNSIHNSTHVE